MHTLLAGYPEKHLKRRSRFAGYMRTILIHESAEVKQMRTIRIHDKKMTAHEGVIAATQRSMRAANAHARTAGGSGDSPPCPTPDLHAEAADRLLELRSERLQLVRIVDHIAHGGGVALVHVRHLLDIARDDLAGRALLL